MKNIIVFKKYLFILCIFLSSCSPQLNENIKKIDSYTQAFDELNECDDQTIVIFDVDDTLITAKDALSHLPHLPFWFKVRAVIRYPRLIWQKNFWQAASIMFYQTEQLIIEPIVINFITKLQQQKCIVIGLTAIESGDLGVIKNVPEWRYTMLSQLGIHFSKTFPDVSFNTLPQYNGTCPILHKGILYANQQPKGIVLKAFLEHFNLKPKRIISFDDSLNALQSVAQECTQADTQCIGYWYQGARKVAPKWDTHRALQQLDCLMQCSTWISDATLDKKNA